LNCRADPYPDSGIGPKTPLSEPKTVGPSASRCRGLSKTPTHYSKGILTYMATPAIGLITASVFVSVWEYPD
jgi:hypothetical protein